jgi:hypothetical protein
MLIDYKQQLGIIGKIRSGKLKQGYGLGIDEIDKFIVYKPSNFNIILGHANVGKTTAIIYLMLAYSLKHGKKWLICSTENESYSLIRKLVEFLDENSIELVSDNNFKTHTDFINQHFKFVDNAVMYTYITAIEMFGKVKKEFNFDGILLDPYNSLAKEPEMMKNLGGHEYDYQACTELRMFCKENKVSIWLNTHANTTALRMRYDNSHPFAGFPQPPSANDVEGGGKFVNRADDFIVIHRLVEHKEYCNTTMIFIKKVKETETGGKVTFHDKPIEIVSMEDNKGFALNGKSILQTIKESQLNFL